VSESVQPGGATLLLQNDLERVDHVSAEYREPTDAGVSCVLRRVPEFARTGTADGAMVR